MGRVERDREVKDEGIGEMTIRFNPATLHDRYDGIQGETIGQIACAIEKSRSFVWNRLVEAGIERRPSGRRPFRREGIHWAAHWRKCRTCGGTKRLHQGHGLCSRCYRRWFKAGKPRLDDD